MRAAKMGAWELALQTSELFLTAEFCYLFQLAPDSTLTLRDFMELVHPADRDSLETSMRRAIDGNLAEFESDFRVNLAGGMHCMQARGEITRDSCGRAVHLIGVASDISERKRTDHKLSEALHQLKEAERIARLGAWSWDIASGVIIWSDETYRIKGLDPSAPPPSYEELAGIYTTESWPKLDQAVRNALRSGEPYDLQLELNRSDGEVRCVHACGRALRDQSGAVFRLQGTVQDITEKKKNSDQLVLLETCLKNLNDIIVITEAEPVDLPGPRIVYVNDAFTTRTGYTREEAIGKTPRILQGQDTDREKLDEIRNSLKQWKPIRTELLNYTKSGELFWVELEIMPVVNEIGWYTHWVAIQRDITERKQAEHERRKLESQVNQSQKLESIGRLAGGVAHDFNNLLTVINGYSSLLVMKLEPENPMWSMVKAINEAGERAKGLTSQLLAFSRKQPVQPRPMDLNRVVEEVQRVIERLIGEDIDVVSQVDPALGTVVADPDQIHQLLMNLVVNARDAMPEGGRLTIETRNIEIDAYTASLFPSAMPGKFILLRVADSGIGMTPETLKNVFEPFFTTKESGKGTGLGLSTVYGIVMQSHGWIDIDSKVGWGTRVKVYLPRTDSIVPLEGLMSATDDKPAHGTILLVEDEEAVRKFARMALESEGYTILEAAGADEAYQLAINNAEPIDLMLTDVILRGMNGKKLSELIATVQPDARILFMSGYTADVLSSRGVMESSITYLQKPFTREEMLAKVRSVLTRR
jgi:PAS domain S-box-containing protein